MQPLSGQGYEVPPDSNNVQCLQIRFHYGDSAMVWSVPGSAFYEGGALKGPFEQNVGTFILREDALWNNTPPARPNSTKYSVEHVSDSVNAWQVHLWDYPQGNRYITQRDSLTASDFEIEIIWLGAGDIFIDALCISDPQGYGLFVHDGSSWPGFENNRYRDSINLVFNRLGVNNTGQNPLRLIELGESVPWCGNSTTLNYLASILDSLTGTNDTTLVFSYGMDWSEGYQDKYASEIGNAVSGSYYYPIANYMSRPENVRYYNVGYIDTMWGNFHQYSHWLKAHSLGLQRSQGTSKYDWTPAIGNHSWSFRNGFRWTAPPQDWKEEQREPTAAEIRFQVNMALCYGAKSIIYATYCSIPPALNVDSIATPDTLINRGEMGFINIDLSRRTQNVWGEDKYDSTARFNNDFVKPMGITMLPFRWENAIAFNDAALRNDDYVSWVVSERLNRSLDYRDSTFVEVGRFSNPGETHAVYLYVVNKRTDTLGHRHITVKLKPGAGGVDYWKVTNLSTKDVWIVNALSNTDTNHVGGFTDYFRPSDGALYKLEEIVFDSGESNPIHACC